MPVIFSLTCEEAMWQLPIWLLPILFLHYVYYSVRDVLADYVLKGVDDFTNSPILLGWGGYH